MDRFISKDVFYHYSSISHTFLPLIHKPLQKCALCPSLTNTQGPFCACAPSIRRWKRYVSERYGSADDEALTRAYAEMIVGEYASRYGDKLAGFAFDRVASPYPRDTTDDVMISLLESNVRAHIPMAVLSYEMRGGTGGIPLRRDSYPHEDFTFGYPSDLRHMLPSLCENYPSITSLETTTSNGYYFFHNDEPNNKKGSLGHVHTPINKSWIEGDDDNDDIIWDIKQAQEWQSRVMNAKGAWTWGVAQGVGRHSLLLLLYDLDFLEWVYEGLRDGPPYARTCG